MKYFIRGGILVIVCLLVLAHAFIMDKVMSDSLNKEYPETVAFAYFAGGCFWCMEPVFDNIPGVLDTISGYMGGSEQTANYAMVSAGSTNHKESIKVVYDHSLVDYLTLVNAFWRSIDPTDQYGQFADKGAHYQTAIFYQTELEKQIANESKQALMALNKFKDPIVTEIISAMPFYPAEEYHQNYYQKNTLHYNSYKEGSGRAGFIRSVWGN